MELGLALLGLGIAAGTLSAILWSIAYPKYRLWPPRHYTALTPILVWVPTLALFGVLIALGILGWGDVEIPSWVRFGFGVPAILVSNIAVWTEVAQFGVSQTSGEKGALRTEGLYRFSRNPQYVADITMIIGWIVLSCAPWAFIVGIAAIVVLVAAPFSEEPWLSDQYGKDFALYASCVRRFL